MKTSSFNNINEKKALSLIRVLLVLMTVWAGSACLHAEQTAAQLISACNTKIRQSGGLTASFTMSTDGRTVKGTMKSTGSKFAISTSAMSTWYDGKSMWTYNPRTKETTLVTPSASELAEANPLLLISTKISDFTASYAKSQKAGQKTVILTPKKKGTGIKSMHVTINTTTQMPTKLVAVPSSGRTITLTLSSVKAGQKHSDATFVYPKSSYPGVNVVDLR